MAPLCKGSCPNEMRTEGLLPLLVIAEGFNPSVKTCGFATSPYTGEAFSHRTAKASPAISMLSAMSASVREQLMKWLWWLVRYRPRR